MAETDKNYDRLRAVLVLISTIAVIGFSALASTGRLYGVETGDVSDRFPTVLSPAAYAFSIWSLIYFGMTAFSIYQLMPSQLAKLRGVRTLYLLSCLLNCAWLYAWHHYWIGVSVLLIFGLLSTLAIINFRLGAMDKGLALLLAKVPFGIYFGWVTAAALVNFVIFLKYAGVTMSDAAWNTLGIALIGVSLLAAALVRIQLRNFVYPLAVCWALTAIAIKQSGNTAVILAAAIAVILCLVLSLSFVMDLRHSRQ